MFFNRIYFTTRHTFRRLNIQQYAYNRHLVTFNSPNGGKGGPNFDYILTVFVMGSGFYLLNKKR
jgi:hypothetical protein